MELASLLLNSIKLKTEAEPFLRRLSQITGQTLFLATLQDKEAVYLEKVEQYNSLPVVFGHRAAVPAVLHLPG